MGNVGISFGSPTGGQGFDVATTVDRIVTNLQTVEAPWKNQLTKLQSQDAALTSIGTDLSALATALQSLTDFQGTFSAKEGSSSNTSVLALTNATSAAVAGGHTVVVGLLAQTYSYASGGITATDTLSGSVTIGGAEIAISDGTALDSNGDTIPANNTLSSLASYINNGGYGVRANVVTDSTGSRLALVSTISGGAGAVAIDSSSLTDATTSTGISITQAQKGQDAQLSVDGISMTSSSNTVTTAIPGVTMQLLDISSNPVQVEITNNNAAVETSVSNFVTAYNKVIGDLNKQEGSDSTGNPEPLFGNPAVALLQQQLQTAMNFTQSSGAITTLSQLGITASTSYDGTLTLDATKLDSALNSNYQDVMNLFQSNGSYTSLGASMTKTLNNLSNSAPTGAIYLALQQDSAQENALNSNITNQETLIDAEKARLTTELNAANYMLQEIPQQLQYVNEIYSAITGYNQQH